MIMIITNNNEIDKKRLSDSNIFLIQKKSLIIFYLLLMNAYNKATSKIFYKSIWKSSAHYNSYQFFSFTHRIFILSPSLSLSLSLKIIVQTHHKAWIVNDIFFFSRRKHPNILLHPKWCIKELNNTYPYPTIIMIIVGGMSLISVLFGYWEIW